MEALFHAAFPFWEKLNAAERTVIIEGAQLQKYEKGQFLYYGAGECAGLQLLKKGKVRVFLNSPNGGEITLYRLSGQDFCILSAACMMKNLQLEIHLEIEEDAELYVIPGSVFKPLSDSNPAIKDFVLELVSARFSEVMWLMNQLIFSNMGTRLAQALLERSRLAGELSLSITHDVLARDLGTAREVVTRLLKQFQLDGLVALARGRIQILDAKGLKEV